MKIKDVIVLNEVKHDLDEGRDFYDKKENGIGNYFWDSLIADIDSLLIYAGIHSKRFGLYRMQAKRFPYAIYYDIQNEAAIVVAVLPMYRNPVWIKSKLKGRS